MLAGRSGSTAATASRSADPDHPWRRPLALSITGGLLILGLQLAAAGPKPPWAAHEPTATQANVVAPAGNAAGHARRIRVPGVCTHDLPGEQRRTLDRPHPRLCSLDQLDRRGDGPGACRRVRPGQVRVPAAHGAAHSDERAAQGRRGHDHRFHAGRRRPTEARRRSARSSRAGPRRTTPRSRASRAGYAWPGSASCSRRRG